MELQNEKIKFIPDIHPNMPSNFLAFVQNLIAYIENMMDLVPHVISQNKIPKVQRSVISGAEGSV